MFGNGLKTAGKKVTTMPPAMAMNTLVTHAIIVWRAADHGTTFRQECDQLTVTGIHQHTGPSTWAFVCLGKFNSGADFTPRSIFLFHALQRQRASFNNDVA